MEPQSTQQTPKFTITPRVIAIGIGAIILIIIVLSILLSVRYPAYIASATPLRADRDFGYLQGSDVYGYSGMSFYKINLAKNNEVTVLNQGLKLPTPDTIFWANSQGALVHFNGSFIHTAVEHELALSGKIVDDETKSYIWYVNFADSTLHLVSTIGLSSNLATFSAADNGFYYMPDFIDVESDSNSAPPTPLHFYNIATHSDEVISNDLGLLGTRFIGPCPDASLKVCLIGRNSDDATKTRLIGITKDNKNTTLLESAGRIFATNVSHLYINATETTSNPKYSDQVGEETNYSNMSTALYDIKTKSSTPLAFKIDDEDIFPYITSAKDYYAISTKGTGENTGNVFINGAPSTIGLGKSTEQPLMFSDGKLFNAGVREVAGYGNDKLSLITTAGGAQLLFSQKNQPITIQSVDQKTVANLVNTCAAGATVQYFDENHEFKVYFADDNTFPQTSVTYSNCVAKANKQALVGFNFYIGARDPGNGRITTD